jgi:two-component system chemotaxis response regulator CheB
MSHVARVLIVDDSRIYRGAIEEALRGQDDVALAGSVFSGEKAIEFIRRHPPDVVTLDVEMPGMSGLETLHLIKQWNRTQPAHAQVGVIMVSAFTRRGADVTVQSLQAGAFDFVTKPSGTSPESSVLTLRNHLLPMIRAFVTRRRHSPSGQGSPPATSPLATNPGVARKVRAILIAASTGGPQALAHLLPELSSRTELPILVVQHMPAGFTKSLAENLSRRCGGRVFEAEDGQIVVPRSIYIAPGGQHMVLRTNATGQLTTGLNAQPPESGCRPSASVLFRSAATILGAETIAVVLTGMGDDGTAGLGPLKRAGGYVIAQDEPSSVVWGMPGSAVAAGLTDAVVPLSALADAVEAAGARKARC